MSRIFGGFDLPLLYKMLEFAEYHAVYEPDRYMQRGYRKTARQIKRELRRRGAR